MLYTTIFTAVQHERAPKMSNASATSAINYPSTFYAAARYPDGIFPFQMHLTAPLTFPFVDNYHHLPVTTTTAATAAVPPYYPHLAESLNIKINQSIYRPTPANYDHEIGKILTNNFLTRVPNINNNNNNDVMKKEDESNGVDKSAKENEVTSSEEIPSMTSSDASRLKSTQSLYDAASKILFLAIRWAKSIPSFNQLPSVEQKKLLNECWSELFIIAAAQWGLCVDEMASNNSHYLKQLQGFIKHFSHMKIDHFEAACLKALILFRGTLIDDQTITQQLLLLQNQTLCLLIEKCGALRLGHLLLLLPQIKIIGSATDLQVE